MSRTPSLLTLALLVACAPADGPTDGTDTAPTDSPTPSESTPEPAPGTVLMVSGYHSDAIHLFDGLSGKALGELTGVPGAQSVHRGPDGHLYAVAEKINQIVRFDGADLSPLGPFVLDDPNTPEDELGGLRSPTAAVFGPDGDLYVCGYHSSDVTRFNGSDGEWVSTAVPPGTGGLAGPDAGMQFLDGSLIVPGFDSDSLLRFDPHSGALLATIADADDGLSDPRGVLVLGDRLWLTNWRSGQVLPMHLDGSDSTPFADVAGATGITQSPDSGEILIIDGNDDVQRYHPETGEHLGRLIRGARAGIDGANFLAWQ